MARQQLSIRCLAPAKPPRIDDGRKLDLKVVFTDLPKTRAALLAARTMAQGLSARITLLMAEVVPYPLPLAQPPVPIEITERLLESVVSPDQQMDDQETAVEIYLCRDRSQAIRDALQPESLVIVGARKWLWFAWERSLARLLRREGRHVLTV